MENKKRLIIIDSNSIIHRAFHALPPLTTKFLRSKNECEDETEVSSTTKKGEVVGAVYGFLLVFFRAIKDFQPDFVAACFDVHAPTFRSKIYKEYKTKRPPAPKELYEQIPKIKDVLKSFKVQIFEKEGFEADDIIGTIANLVPKKQIIPTIETIILSGDSDTLQLVDQQTKVYFLRKGVKDIVLYDEKLVQEKYKGLTSKQLLDFKSLKGDPSDNIPGVTGIGEKTATILIEKAGNLENLYNEIHSPQLAIRDSLKTLLLRYKEQAFLSKDLVKIDKNVPIDFSLEKCLWGNYNKEEAFSKLKEFGFYSLINKLS